MAVDTKSITLKPPDPERRTPAHLYKYRTFESVESKAQLRSILVDHKLYFSTRTKFNDPFDCLMPSFEDVPKAEMLKFIKDRLRSIGLARNRDEARDLAKKIDLTKLRTDIQLEINKAGILSLTEDPQNMLMWGHYAESHKGLCLKFAISDTEAFFGRVQPVIYSIDRPQFDPMGEENDNVDSAVLTKSIDWMYELEWRITYHDKGFGSYEFPSDKLVGIVFGFQMQKAERDQVLDYLTRGGLSAAAISEALPDEREYRMRLQPLK